ncbi:hypothetical protein ACP4OV_026328 [Aristida adscensionis]
MSGGVESTLDLLSCLTGESDDLVHLGNQDSLSGYLGDDEESLDSIGFEEASLSGDVLVLGQEHAVDVQVPGIDIAQDEPNGVELIEGGADSVKEHVPLLIANVALDRGDGHSHNGSPVAVVEVAQEVTRNLRRRRIEVDTEAEKRARVDNQSSES